jgi:hypothetical protein
LSQTEPPRYEDNETSFAELQGRIAKTIAFLEAIPDAAFASAETRELAVPLAREGTARDGRTCLVRFGFPNFYFDLATAYNILRQNGVPFRKPIFFGRVELLKSSLVRGPRRSDQTVDPETQASRTTLAAIFSLKDIVSFLDTKY